MARPLRMEYPGAWYLVMNRGRRGERVFARKDDHDWCIEIPREAIEFFALRVSAFCLMPNHGLDHHFGHEVGLSAAKPNEA